MLKIVECCLCVGLFSASLCSAEMSVNQSTVNINIELTRLVIDPGKDSLSLYYDVVNLSSNDAVYLSKYDPLIRQHITETAISISSVSLPRTYRVSSRNSSIDAISLDGETEHLLAPRESVPMVTRVRDCVVYSVTETPLDLRIFNERAYSCRFRMCFRGNRSIGHHEAEISFLLSRFGQCTLSDLKDGVRTYVFRPRGELSEGELGSSRKRRLKPAVSRE